MPVSLLITVAGLAMAAIALLGSVTLVLSERALQRLGVEEKQRRPGGAQREGRRRESDGDRCTTLVPQAVDRGHDREPDGHHGGGSSRHDEEQRAADRVLGDIQGMRLATALVTPSKWETQWAQ